MGHLRLSQMSLLQCWKASRRNHRLRDYGLSDKDCLPPAPGHPDQIPYIAIGRGLIDREGGPYTWVKAFLSPQDPRAYVLATKMGNSPRVKEAKTELPVFQGETPEEKLFPFPYSPQSASSASAGAAEKTPPLQIQEPEPRDPGPSDSGRRDPACSTRV